MTGWAGCKLPIKSTSTWVMMNGQGVSLTAAQPARYAGSQYAIPDTNDLIASTGSAHAIRLYMKEHMYLTCTQAEILLFGV